jgi:hypothetical protein
MKKQKSSLIDNSKNLMISYSTSHCQSTERFVVAWKDGRCFENKQNKCLAAVEMN